MSIPSTHTEDLKTSLLNFLSHTPYAAESLVPIPGGTTSFVYRATPRNPIQQHEQQGKNNATTTENKNESTISNILVKHATQTSPLNPSLSLPANRLSYEATMLRTLHTLSPLPPFLQDDDVLRVNVPRIHAYYEDARLLVAEYIPHTATLRSVLAQLSPTLASRVGFAVGMWLRRLHSLCYDGGGGGVELLEKVEGNSGAVRLKREVGWVQGTRVLEGDDFGVGAREREVWGFVRGLEESGYGGGDGEVGVVHGDFWSGNILVPTALVTPSPAHSLPNSDHQQSTLHTIDFELSHVAHPSTDTAQFLGDLLERYHISATPPASIGPLIAAFVEGYGPVSEEMCWRTVVRVGVHVVNWWSRGPRGRGDVDEATRRRGVVLVRLGVRWVRGGFERDRRVFEGTGLEVLFEKWLGE